MIKIPFTSDSFAYDIKSKMSGVNITLEFENMESALFQYAHECQRLIGKSTYDFLMEKYKSTVDDLENPALVGVDMLQRAMLHGAMYEQLIFLIVRVGNDGVTVKKNDDETTIFRYQQDELKNTLINAAWFWHNQLFEEMNANQDVYTTWKDADEQKEISELPVGVKDFAAWVGVNSSYFLANCRWIVREIYEDTFKPIGLPIEGLSQSVVSRAIVYRTMWQACLRLPYELLPESIRKDIDNEQSKSNKQAAETLIREKIALQFFDKSERYLLDLQSAVVQKKNTTASDRAIVSFQPKSSSTDKFVVS